MGYLLTAGVNARLDTAVARHATIATRGAWQVPTYDRKAAGWVKIAATTAASPPTRWSVLITGGVHARELAPPDALVSFVERLLDAYDSGTGLVYPAFTTGGVTYPEFTVSLSEVQSVVERLDLVVAPLVNADGREFVLTTLPATATTDEVLLHLGWRKNRRPKPATETAPETDGVDINRNFDVAFDFMNHYNFMLAGVHTSNLAKEEDFCGPTAASEPETQNLVKLMQDEDVSHYLDVHSFARTVMYSWGIEANQTNDPAMSFLNSAWDHKRDGTTFNTYREYIPSAQEATAKAIADRMVQDILTRAAGSDPTAKKRSTYEAIPSSKLYVTSGAADDFCFSRWFTAAVHGRPIRPVVALTMEAGGDVRKLPAADFDEGGFWPNSQTQFPKIEREIHVAVWSFLTQVAAIPVSGPTAPLLPINAGRPSGGSGCLSASLLTLAIAPLLAVHALFRAFRRRR